MCNQSHRIFRITQYRLGLTQLSIADCLSAGFSWLGCLWRSGKIGPGGTSLSQLKSGLLLLVNVTVQLDGSF